MILIIDLVWKVARYTSAGPTYFTECDNYVDGGVMANNPSMAAWVEINKYYDSKVLVHLSVCLFVCLCQESMCCRQSTIV